MKNVYIYDGVRSAFGRYGGQLKSMRPDDLLAANIKAIIKRHPKINDTIEDVVIGDSNQAGEDSRNIARNALLLAGVPISSGGISLNRLCGSGLAAAQYACNAIKCEEGDLYLAGGVECMTRAPFIVPKTEKAFGRSMEFVDSTMGWRLPNKKLLDEFGADSMPETSDNIAKEIGISREDSDLFAYQSQMKYEQARQNGFYDDEIFSLLIPASNKKETNRIFKSDEHPRPDTSLEKLAKLRVLNPGGVATAGNSSGINDGSAVLLLGSESVSDLIEIKPSIKIIATAITGLEPRLMGLGPVAASIKVLERTGLTLKEMDLIEINEAFGTQVLGCLKEMKIPFNDQRVNPNGGAITIGHPLGASGARLLLTASRELKRRGGKYALVSLCIGIGQGIATVIENTSN